MRDRWRPVFLLAGVLFAINAVVRFIVWQLGTKSDTKQIMLGLFGLGAVTLIMAVAGWRWGRRYPMSRVTPDLSVVVAVGCLLTVLIGPFAGGSAPFREGAGFFFGEIWQYLAFAGGGAIVGLLILIALGLDYRSQALKRYAETKMAKPRRVVRR
jgi:tryptophan-rich sensory protein